MATVLLSLMPTRSRCIYIFKYDILTTGVVFADKIRQVSETPAGRRGTLFETLVKDTLTVKFVRIETWPEYAEKHSKHSKQDIGIDLVAYDSEDTKHAIKCTYKNVDTQTLKKPDIDRFLKACRKHGMGKKILAYVGPNLKPNVNEACRGIELYKRQKLARIYNSISCGGKWKFPHTGGVSEVGFNQAGIEAFGGRQNQQRATLPKQVIKSAVRELLQNSIDAKNSNMACRVTFERAYIDPDTIAAADLCKHMEACDAEDDHPEFFRAANKTLVSAPIDAIRVTDSNTTGLYGKNWRMCTVVEGRSAKDSETSGGSFGLGKNAPFAMSGVSVVCYATKLSHGRCAVGEKRVKSIAKCRVISHKMSGEMLQHIGELDSYIQTLTRPGTSITIVGTRHITSKRSWKQEFIEAVRHNFFIAIADGELECDIQGTHVKIDESSKSGDVLQDKRRTRTPSYLEAVRMYRGKSDKQNIRFGELSFDAWIAASADDDNMYENRCLFVNKKGMLITAEQSIKRNPFHVQNQSHGSFLVLVRSADDNTEKHMREMEPPSHAEIDVLKSPEHKPTLRKIKEHIESRIREILFADSDQDNVTELSDLADILPIKRDAENQTKLDAFIRKSKKKRGRTGAIATGDSGNGGRRNANDTGSGTTPEGGSTRQQRGGDEIRMDDVRMISDSPGRLRVYGTLSWDGSHKPVNIVIRRAAESMENDGTVGRLPVREARAVFLSDDGEEDAVKVEVHDSERKLAVAAAPRVYGKRLRLDITLREPEPVMCAYEIGVVDT